MFLTDRKLVRRIQELEPYRYRDIIPMKYFDAAEDHQGVVNHLERKRQVSLAV